MASGLAAIRGAAQLLHRPARLRHPADVARAIAGAQAQDAYAGRQSLRARNGRLVAADVDAARNEERSLIRAWAMRGTMHLLAADDAPWMLPLFDPQLVAMSRRRLAQLGVSEARQERALRVMRERLGHGPLTRNELAEPLQGAGITINDQTRTHLWRLVVGTGIACLGPDRGARSTLVLAEDWLGPRPRHDREAALRELARRFLRAFGPASERDFAGWSGLPLRDLRPALEGIAGELREQPGEGETLLSLRAARPRPLRSVTRLLPAFDTYLMGHRDASFMAGAEQWRQILPGGGVLRPVITHDGVALGTWNQRRTPGAIEIELSPFAAPPAGVAADVEAELADIARFEGMPVKLV